MADLSALGPITTGATALAGLVLVTPGNTQGYQPMAAFQSTGDEEDDDNEPPPALLFHYEGEQTLTSECEVTDHYVEDNSAVQDHIAIKPIVVTTKGFIGELNNIPPAALAVLKTIANKLTAVVAYTPEVSETAQNAYNQAFFAYQVAASLVNSAVSAWSSIFGDGLAVIGDEGISGFDFSTGEVQGAQNEQQTIFQQFFGYQQERTLFTIQTPWAILENMVLMALRPVQAADSEVITEYELHFKQIRKASTLSGKAPVTSGQLTPQASGNQDGGTSAATSNDASQGSAIDAQEGAG